MTIKWITSAAAALAILLTAAPAHADTALTVNPTATVDADGSSMQLTGTLSCTGGATINNAILNVVLAASDGTVVPTFGLLTKLDASTNGFAFPIICDGGVTDWMIEIPSQAIVNLIKDGWTSPGSGRVSITLTSVLPVWSVSAINQPVTLVEN